MTLRERVEKIVRERKNDIKRKIHEDVHPFPAWEQLVRLAQQGSKDAELMARLDY